MHAGCMPHLLTMPCSHMANIVCVIFVMMQQHAQRAMAVRLAHMCGASSVLGYGSVVAIELCWIDDVSFPLWASATVGMAVHVRLCAWHVFIARVAVSNHLFFIARSAATSDGLLDIVCRTTAGNTITVCRTSCSRRGTGICM